MASVTFSSLKFTACDPKDPMQHFEMEEPAGTGQIHDAETGRCLSVKDCVNKQPSSDSIPYKDIGEVVLDSCDAGNCQGKNAMWKVVPGTVAGWSAFESNDVGSSQACFTLNAVGDGGASTNSWPLVVWGTAGACDHASPNNLYKWDPSTKLLKVNFLPPLSGCTDAANCCLVALPCTEPCHLLSSNWGITFIVTLLVGCVLYVGGGMGYSVKVLGKSKDDGLTTLLPNRAFWSETKAMVSDGMAFFTAQVQAQINKRKSGYTPIIDDASASTNSKAEPATKSAVKPQAKAAANGSSSDDADDGLAE